MSVCSLSRRRAQHRRDAGAQTSRAVTGLWPRSARPATPRSALSKNAAMEAQTNVKLKVRRSPRCAAAGAIVCTRAPFECPLKHHRRCDAATSSHAATCAEARAPRRRPQPPHGAQELRHEAAPQPASHSCHEGRHDALQVRAMANHTSCALVCELVCATFLDNLFERVQLMARHLCTHTRPQAGRTSRCVCFPRALAQWLR